MKTSHSVLYMPSIFRRNKSKAPKNPSEERQPVALERGWWKAPLLFMLMMALMGLDFVPALLIAAIMLMHYYRKDKYMCLVMIMILCGGFGMFTVTNIKFWPSDIALVVAVVLWVVFKRTPFLTRTLFSILCYGASLVVIASFSIESMSVQLYSIRQCLLIGFIIIPVVLMRGERFDIVLFFRRLLAFVLIMSIFYIVDSVLLSGNVLVPRATAIDVNSTLFDLYWAPGSFYILRKYPHGMFIISLMLYGAARVVKLRWWHWLLIVLAILSTQTFTFILAVTLVYFFLVVKPIKILKYSLLLIAGAVAVYCVDSILPQRTGRDVNADSRLRVKSSVDQFVALFSAVDDEDLAQFASGRLAQALPKLELVAKEKRQLTGLGFLHPEKSKIKQYIIINEYYTDVARNEEVATGVEIVPVQAYLSAGWLGVIAITLFFFTLYFMERRMRHSTYFLSVICFDFLAGLGGFLGYINNEGVIMIATSYAVVYLAQKRIDADLSDERKSDSKTMITD